MHLKRLEIRKQVKLSLARNELIEATIAEHYH